MHIEEAQLRKIVRSHPSCRSSEADDLQQLARIVVWRAGQRYPDLAPAVAAKFVRQAVAQHGQRTARRPTTVSLDALLAPTAEGEPGWDVADPEAVDPASSVNAGALRRWFGARIEHLPALDREVVCLRYGWNDGQERSLREVAAALGVTLPWVQRALARAHRALRIACEREGFRPDELLADLRRAA